MGINHSFLSLFTIMESTAQEKRNHLTFNNFKDELLNDYKIGWESRHLSYMGRKEVLNGKAKFGIFGPGVELAQIAMAKVFNEGDFRSGSLD